MTPILYTFGYERQPITALIQAVETFQAVVIDTRYNPVSHRQEWAGENVARAVNTDSITGMALNRYLWVREFGNLNYKTPGAPFELAAPMAGLAKVAPLVDQSIPMILLCYEANPRKCHRRDVATLIAERWHLAIMHLTGDPGQMAFPWS